MRSSPSACCTHTPDTRAAFESLLRFLKPGGSHCDLAVSEMESPARRGEQLLAGAHHAAAARGGARDCRGGGTDRRNPIPPVQTRAGVWRVGSLGRPRSYYRSFSNHPDRRQRICDTFDWMTPQYQWHHTDEEVRGWFEAAGLMDVRNLSETSELVHPGQGEGVNFSGRKPVAGDRPQ